MVVQETLSRHVNIIRREGEITKISQPEIQTYGENIGLITSHVFGLSTDITDFHYEIDNILNSMTDPFQAKQSDEAVLKYIKKVFDNEISMQAMGYILSQLASRDS